MVIYEVEDKDLQSQHSLAEKYGDEVPDESVMKNVHSIAPRPLYSNIKVHHLQLLKGSFSDN